MEGGVEGERKGGVGRKGCSHVLVVTLSIEIVPGNRGVKVGCCGSFWACRLYAVLSTGLLLQNKTKGRGGWESIPSPRTPLCSPRSSCYALAMQQRNIIKNINIPWNVERSVREMRNNRLRPTIDDWKWTTPIPPKLPIPPPTPLTHCTQSKLIPPPIPYPLPKIALPLFSHTFNLPR